MQPYEIVKAFEREVARYAGAAYGVAVNSCTSAIMLSVRYAFMQGGCDGRVWLPKYTYVGVPQAVLAAGGTCRFRNYEWQGAYEIFPHRVVDSLGVRIIDSARRFYRDMYVPTTLHCLSFHWAKHLPVGRGGMILTDDKQAADTLRRMRYDGRAPGVPPAKDDFTVPGWHCYMIPEDAARGLMLMQSVKDFYEDIPWDGYPDLSQFPMFQEGAHAVYS